MKFNQRELCVPFISLAVLRALRTLETMAGQAVLQIMPWSSCYMVYIISGRNQ
jgi:hypothetical protein